jgi:hypothetical protein
VRRETAESFVVALNAFDGEAIGAMVTPSFRFTIGGHVADRDDFLASLDTGPTADPYFRFERAAYEEDGSAVLVTGSQVYRWRESDEIAHSSDQELRLEFEDGLVASAVVTPHQ